MQRRVNRGVRARVAVVLGSGLILLMLETATRAQQLDLGDVSFPTSARSEQAQAHFLRGLAALHSFWYPVALAEFRQATAIEPDFMMGYWGEAMAHNHPIWGDPQKIDAARQMIGKIQITDALTDRERSYLNAVKILYGQGDKAERDNAYAAAMEKLSRTYPDDAEAALFYALALLGSAEPGPVGEQRRLQAGAIAEKIFAQKPNHPGAAHYVIHAYDDPQHAQRALAAARRYAQIAPAAPHALHMPSHIFLQLGMWPEAAAANEASWAASDAWVKQHQLPVSQRDYHSLQWLQYAYLQQGRYDEAKRLLETMQQSFATFPTEDVWNRAYGAYALATMAAAYVIETQQWDQADALLGPAPDPQGAESARERGPNATLALLAQTPAVFARGLAAAIRGADDAQKSVALLQTISSDNSPAPIAFVTELRQVAGMQALEITAAAEAARGNIEAALRTMEHAATIIDRTPPPPGPPPLIKPVQELFGELLLRANRPQEAAQHFATSLARHPDRARSLLGAAQAAADSGASQKAAALYGKVVQQWQHADPQLAELQRAQAYVQQARVDQASVTNRDKST